MQSHDTPSLDPLDPSDEEYRRIEERIAADDSPVGIDAKKTHVLILHRLAVIERRLAAIEQRLGREGDETLPL